MYRLLFALFIAACFAVLAASGSEAELKIEVTHTVKCGAEEKSKKGDELHMHYTGTLEKDGSKFDSSYDRKEPFVFTIGSGQVIKGWEQGLLDMCPGEKRKLTIPSHLGYGDSGAGDKIPGGATLVFEVELLDVQEGKPQPNVFKEIDSNKDNQLSQDEVSKFIREQEKTAKMDPTADEEHNTMVTDIFQQEDKDRDGFISHDEFSGPKHDEL